MTTPTVPIQAAPAKTAAALRMHAVIDSPIGPLTLVTEDGSLTGLYMDVTDHRPDDGTLGVQASIEDDEVLAEAARQLGEYFAGELTTFDLPISLDGTGFQRTVWQACRRSRTARRSLTESSRSASASRQPRGRSAWRTAVIRCRSWCPAIGSSARTAA